MPIEGLKIIGESINDSVPSTNKLYKENNIEGIKDLAKLQEEKGAAYIDVNVGSRTPEFMAQMVKEVQSVTSKPLSIDSPDFNTVKAGLEAYDLEKAGGKIPVLNSISPLRTEMFDLLKTYNFIPILMVSERNINGKSSPNHTVEATFETAKYMHAELKKYADLPNDQIIFDVGIAPIASDMEGLTKRTVESIKRINQAPKFKGVHMSLGLSNFTVMLPSKCKDGTPVKSSLESAFLTLTVKNGLDMVIGSVKRKYRILDDSHPAMQCLNDVLQKDGFEILMRVQSFYS
ncbi:MAG: dihydropteroate synthase [Victivallales bacterium]|nr:dihydropteroate synthase [Victivallales bacterium]MCF7888794.1 dihydropteroate synthase [Victivallales bacterium]